MIANQQVLFPSLVLDLMRSDIKFHLTGSRFFGGANEKSDWDFITEANPVTMSWLEANGFETDLDSSYSDPTIVKVLYGYCVHNGSRVKVDVQLVESVSTKLYIQSILKDHWKHGLPVDKEVKKQIWNAAYAVYKSVSKTPA